MRHQGVCYLADCDAGGGPKRLCQGDFVECHTEEALLAAKEAERRRLCRHEAAHAVVSLALGRSVTYVSVLPDDPHVMERGRADGPRWLHDALFVTLAGDLGEGDIPPFDFSDCHARIAASRRGHLGSCDACRVAYYLAGIWGEQRSEEEMTLLWSHLRATVMNLLGLPDIASAIDSLAAALARRPLLLADDLAVIVNASAIKAAAATVLTQYE